MTGWNRVFLKNVDESDPWVVDMIIDDENMIDQKIPFCGWFGELKKSNFEPFVLMPNGAVDFGEREEVSNDWEARLAQTNIRSKPIRVGEYVTFTNVDGEHIYRVERITDLLAP